jgi:hypothetical protein
MNPTAARSLANRLSFDDPEQALKVAQAIDAPWFRCQALSQVARYWPDEKYGRILVEAVRAASAQDQIYNQIAVSAWPIRAYLERENSLPAKKLLTNGIQASGGIENMGSRSEALFSIFQASKPFAVNLWKPVFCALVIAAEPALAWRQLRNLKNAVAMVAASNPDIVRQSLDKLSHPKNISTVQRYLDEGIIAEPRPYFWAEGH